MAGAATAFAPRCSPENGREKLLPADSCLRNGRLDGKLGAQRGERLETAHRAVAEASLGKCLEG